DHLLGSLRGNAAELLDGVLEIEKISVFHFLLGGAVGVFESIENLEEQLVANFGFEAVLCRFVLGNLAALLRRRGSIDDKANLEQVDRAGFQVERGFELAMQ